MLRARAGVAVTGGGGPHSRAEGDESLLDAWWMPDIRTDAPSPQLMSLAPPHT